MNYVDRINHFIDKYKANDIIHAEYEFANEFVADERMTDVDTFIRIDIADGFAYSEDNDVSSPDNLHEIHLHKVDVDGTYNTLSSTVKQIISHLIAE